MELQYNKKYPTINSNLHLDTVLTVKKYLGSYHSYSVVALMMLDLENQGLKIDLHFENFIELTNAAEHLLGVWDKCESNKVLIRNYRTIIDIDAPDDPANTDTTDDPANTDTTDELDRIHYLLENNKVSKNTQEIYKNQTVIYIDVEREKYNVTYRLYRNTDNTPRVLNLILA